jgi:hypothetical protein
MHFSWDRTVIRACDTRIHDAPGKGYLCPAMCLGTKST